MKKEPKITVKEMTDKQKAIRDSIIAMVGGKADFEITEHNFKISVDKYGDTHIYIADNYIELVCNELHDLIEVLQAVEMAAVDINFGLGESDCDDDGEYSND